MRIVCRISIRKYSQAWSPKQFLMYLRVRTSAQNQGQTNARQISSSWCVLRMWPYLLKDNIKHFKQFFVEHKKFWIPIHGGAGGPQRIHPFYLEIERDLHPFSKFKTPWGSTTHSHCMHHASSIDNHHGNLRLVILASWNQHGNTCTTVNLLYKKPPHKKRKNALTSGFGDVVRHFSPRQSLCSGLSNEPLLMKNSSRLMSYDGLKIMLISVLFLVHPKNNWAWGN